MCLDQGGYGQLKHFRTRSSELFRTYFWRQSLANNFVRLMFVYWIGVTLQRSNILADRLKHKTEKTKFYES